MSLLNGTDVRVYCPGHLVDSVVALAQHVGQAYTLYPATGWWAGCTDRMTVISMVVEDHSELRPLVTKMASLIKMSGEQQVFVQYIPTSFQLL